MSDKNYYDQIEKEMRDSGICELDIQLVISKLKDIRKESEQDKDFVSKRNMHNQKNK